VSFPTVDYLRASWRDLRPVLGLEVACFGPDAWPWIDVLAALSLPDAVRIKAEAGGELMGLVLGERRDRRRVGWVSSLAVAPAFRRRGIARELLRRCEAELRTPQLRLALRQTNDAALDAFIAAKTEIDAMLARLAAHSADHFETSPDEINWGHVGTLNHFRAKLREIADMAFCEGEHAV